MKIPKIQSSSVNQTQVANVFKALGSTTRLSIISFLVGNPKANCMRIVAALSHSQSTISKHLSELKSANILKVSYEDAVLVYQINTDFIATVQHFLSEVTVSTPPNIESKVPEEKASYTSNKSVQTSFSALKKYNHVFTKNRK